MTTTERPTARDLIEGLRATRAETLRKFSAIDIAQLDEERPWRGSPSNLRFRLSWLTEGSESRRMRMLGIGRQLGRPRLTDAQHALGIAGEARGRLLGTLVGVPDALFEQPPAPGEWSIRQVLGHVIATDERYRIAVEFAVDRARKGGTGPMRPPDASLPPRRGEAQSTGTVPELIDRLQRGRDAVVATVSGISDDLLSAPTNWQTWDLDVRFRLHRFPAHDREHTIQLRKTLQGIHFAPSEPQLLLADAEAERGMLETMLVNVGDEFLHRQPADGSPTLAQLVEEILEDEQSI